MSVTVGTDAYGCVKAVGGTPIVTKFTMLQFLPLYPLQSFYYFGEGETESAGVPFIASSQSVAIDGLPLARVDWLSAGMAYARAIFATMVVIGFMAIVPVIIYLSGDRLEDSAIEAMRGLIGCFVLGAVGGVGTYLIPLTSRRERLIRGYCGELLGVCIDPAKLSADIAVVIEEYVSKLEIGSERRLVTRGSR